MDLEEALQFLHLRADSTLNDLDASFRSLVKAYHPDRNQEKAEWSHMMTVRLNEAYDLIRLSIQERAETASKSRKPEPMDPQEFRQAFSQAKQEILKGIFLYYTYGLHNVHLRKEGVLHYRFKTALRHLQNGIRHLSILIPLSPKERYRDYLLLFRLFGESFLQNMKINRTFIPNDSLEMKAYRHYHGGTTILDSVLKAKLFPRDFPSDLMTPKSLAVSEHEFIMVITHYQNSSWIQESIIKLTLIELLNRLDKFKAGTT